MCVIFGEPQLLSANRISNENKNSSLTKVFIELTILILQPNKILLLDTNLLQHFTICCAVESLVLLFLSDLKLLPLYSNTNYT